MPDREIVVMTFPQIAQALGRSEGMLRYWADRLGIKRAFRDHTGTYFPFEPFRLMAEQRRQWGVKKR
jgi:hypothetical protein